MPRHVKLQDDTQSTIVYTDEAETDILYTILRKTAGSPGDVPLWRVYDNGNLVRTFSRTKYLCNWLINQRHVRIDHRLIDGGIIAAIKDAQET